MCFFASFVVDSQNLILMCSYPPTLLLFTRACDKMHHCLNTVSIHEEAVSISSLLFFDVILHSGILDVTVLVGAIK